MRILKRPRNRSRHQAGKTRRELHQLTRIQSEKTLECGSIFSFYEADQRISSYHTERLALEAVEPDADPERGLSGAHRERKLGRTALAVPDQKRRHVAQTHSPGGV